MPKPRPSESAAPHPPRRVPLDDSARDAAFRAIARQARVAPQFDLEAMTRRDGGGGEAAVNTLPPIDAAFAHAIYDAVIRRWLTLSYLLNLEIKQGFTKLEPRVQAALLCGAAQMLFLDRVPTHAAINHAVEWAKQMVRPGAGGLVNAVLRKVAQYRGETVDTRETYSNGPDEIPLADGRAMVLALTETAQLPKDPLARLAVVTSHPEGLLLQWSRSAKPDIVRARALHSLIDHPPTILNTTYASAASRAKLTPGNSRSHAMDGHTIFTGPHAELIDLLNSTPDIWAQDPASAGAIRSIGNLGFRPRTIIDYCAGQGTKTRQLAYQFPEAEIIATDAEPGRFEILKDVMDGFLGRVKVEPITGLRSIPGPGSASRYGYADLILLDVPCSNTGVLARRPEARYRFSPDSQKKLGDVQRQIIADVLPLLTDEGGRRGQILYATCSLEPEENSAMAAWAKKWHRFEPTCERTHEPRGQPGGDLAEYSDGGYSVMLRR